MSWTTYLQKHPKSVLREELPILLLAWLERVGLTTEEDAAKSLNVDQKTTHKIFLDLYKDNLVDYGRRWVRISEHGKSLIDRFGLDKDILDDLMQDLDIPESEKKAFTFVLYKYRTEAFRQYLDTSCSIRAFSYLSNNTIAENDVETEEVVDNEEWMGKLSILLRDLKQWFSHSVTTITRNDLPESNISAMLSIAWDTCTGTQLAKNSRLWRANKMLKTCEMHLASRGIKSLLSSNENNKVKNLCFIIDFQNSVPRDDWFNIWVSEFSETWASTQIKRSDAYKRISQRIKLYEPDVRAFSREWWTQSSQPSFGHGENSVDFLFSLLGANSIEEFSAKVGLPKEEGRKLLTNICSKCKSLLD